MFEENSEFFEGMNRWITASEITKLCCPFCGSENLTENGHAVARRDLVADYLCNDCKEAFSARYILVEFSGSSRIKGEIKFSETHVF